MSTESKFYIVAGLFAVGAVMILYVVITMSTFWFLIPGSILVAIFGPWSYVLYAKKGRENGKK